MLATHEAERSAGTHDGKTQYYHYVVTEIFCKDTPRSFSSTDRHTFSTNKMRFITALLVLNAAATAVAFAPPAGHGTSGVRGEAALGAKRDFLRRIFRRPSRLAAKVRMIFFLMVRVRFAFLAFPAQVVAAHNKIYMKSIIVPNKANKRGVVIINAVDSWSGSTGGCAETTTGRFSFILLMPKSFGKLSAYEARTVLVVAFITLERLYRKIQIVPARIIRLAIKCTNRLSSHCNMTHTSSSGAWIRIWRPRRQHIRDRRQHAHGQDQPPCPRGSDNLREMRVFQPPLVRQGSSGTQYHRNCRERRQTQARRYRDRGHVG